MEEREGKKSGAGRTKSAKGVRCGGLTKRGGPVEQRGEGGVRGNPIENERRRIQENRDG